MPFAESFRIAANRSDGAGANGSRRRANCSSAVVIVMFTATELCSPIDQRISRSRTTASDFVVMDRLRPLSSVKTLNILRVTPNLRSAGW